MLRLLFSSIVVVALSFSGLSAWAGEIVDGDPGDGNVTTTAVNDTSFDHLYTLLAGMLSNGQNSNIVEAFPLPYLAPGQTVSSASISFYLESQTPGMTYNLALYGLKRVNATNPAPLTSDWYVGSNDTANTLLAPQFMTPTTAAAQATTYSGANLATFINSQYANPAFSGLGLSKTRYVFFRLNADVNVTNNGTHTYILGSARNPDRTQHPLLSLTISGGISSIAGQLQFSFTLPQNSVTSAGVYNPTTGALIRTLWNNVQYQQGTNYGVWDGKDDSGAAVATGSNYQIKMIYHNVQYVWEGVIGNTSASQSGANVYRAFGKIHDMAFGGSNGYYAVGYDENEIPYHTFVVGSPQVPMGLNMGYDFTDPYSCMYFVATDGTRTYWAKTYGGMSAAYTYVVAYTNSAATGVNNSYAQQYTFPQGSTPSGLYQKYSSVVDLDTAANQANPATGIAVQKTGNELFVSHGNLNVVRVFDKVQGNLLGSFTVQNPGRMATTANGDLWVISNGTTKSVLRYTVTSGTAVLKQTLTGFSNPAGLGVSADDSLLLVTDGGASQQIKAYNNSTGASVWTYGSLGGMPVTGPNITTGSFNFNTQFANSTSFSNEAFIAFQPDNTFWVEDGGNGRVLHFSINGNTLVYIEQIAYMDASYRSTVDLTDATRVFNNFIEYSVNYSLPPGGTNGSWTMVKNWAMGLPNDSTHLYSGFANGPVNVVTLSNGRTYAFFVNNDGNTYDLFELPASGPARFTGYSFSSSIVPLIYADGTLRYNVTNSALTSLACYSMPLSGFDSANNPVWGSPALIASSSLNPSTDPIPWNAFPMRTEITASGGVVDFGANSANVGYHLGTLQLGGTAWQWHASPSVNGPSWFPQDGSFDDGNGVVYAGDYDMALGRNIIYGYHGEFWGGGEASQWINFYDNGLMVGRFGTYGNAGTGNVATNGFAGNAYSPTLVHGPNGKTYLYHNDEANHGGTIRWRIDGWDGITELKGTGVIGSTLSLAASTGPTVTITSPTAGATYLNGGNLTLSAEASSSGASVASVQFFDGSTSLGTVSAAPFVLSYSGLGIGTHVITAKATDSNGLTATSASVTITVGSDGTSAPPPAPASLTSGTVTANSVVLNWTQPAAGTTSSTIGQIISFQFDSAGDANALKPTDVSGAAPYASANYNLLGQSNTNGTLFENLLNNAGATISNLGVNLAIQGSSDTNSTQSLTGTALKLFSAEVNTTYNTTVGATISNIPFASYDVVVYSLPGGLSSGTQSTTVTVNNAMGSSVVQQTFTKVPTGYTLANVAFGTSTTVTNCNVVVVQGLSSPNVEVQGVNVAAFQIVERPYDQGVPTSYNIQRATGTSGTFVTMGTASGTARTYTDTSSLSGSTTYQYRLQAVNSFGTSGYSNTVSITTPVATSTTTTSFASWQAQYFTTAQLADPTVSGPTADPYGSGVPNLLAYALQLNPATARPTDVPSPTIVNGHLAVTYFVPSTITDITYIVEVSSDLITWNSGTGYTQVTSNVVSSTGNTITVQDSLSAATQKHFMRLRVTQN